MRIGRSVLTLSLLLVAAVCVAGDVDPYLWLEDVDGEKALAWAKERSAKDTAELEAVPGVHAGRLVAVPHRRRR